MVLETLRYADEVNKAQGYFRDIPDAKPDAELLDLAETLIEKKTAAFDPKEYHDRYVDALKDLIARKRKAKGRRIIEEEEESSGRGASNVVDLMAALKKSLDKPGVKPAKKNSVTTTKKTAAKKSPAKAAPAKKTAARKRA
jgi:DNA end-binding protein Ku